MSKAVSLRASVSAPSVCSSARLSLSLSLSLTVYLQYACVCPFCGALRFPKWHAGCTGVDGAESGGTVASCLPESEERKKHVGWAMKIFCIRSSPEFTPVRNALRKSKVQ